MIQFMKKKPSNKKKNIDETHTEERSIDVNNNSSQMKKIDHNIAALIFRLAGFLFIGSSLLCFPWLASKFDPNPPFDTITSSTLKTAQSTFLLLSIIVLSIAEFITPSFISRYLRRLFDKQIMIKLLISLMVIALPLTIAEIGLHPFTTAHMIRKNTTLFVRDPDLGWCMRPNSNVNLDGIKYKTNSKGLRGPEIPYSRIPSKPRILHLGDSVPFGYGVPDYQDTYPYIIETLLEKELKQDIETINAAIAGYSPWQEFIFLEKEGLKYKPDAVILGFVLNDVVEKFELTLFGGKSSGYQLNRSYQSLLDWIISNSAIYSLIQRIIAKIRFGSDIQQGAVAQEIASVQDLARYPESQKVQDAWSLTLENLEKLFTLCRNHDIPIFVIIFPFVFQFDHPNELSAPQKVITSFCEKNHVPSLDLLPLLVNYLESEKASPDVLLFDQSHLTARGSRIIAEMVVAHLHSESTIWSRITQLSNYTADNEDDKSQYNIK